MSRARKYSKEMLQNLYEEYLKSGKKLKALCKEKELNYISIYTAFRKNGIVEFLKKGKKEEKKTTKKTSKKVDAVEVETEVAETPAETTV